MIHICVYVYDEACSDLYFSHLVPAKPVTSVSQSQFDQHSVQCVYVYYAHVHVLISSILKVHTGSDLHYFDISLSFSLLSLQSTIMRTRFIYQLPIPWLHLLWAESTPLASPPVLRVLTIHHCLVTIGEGPLLGSQGSQRVSYQHHLVVALVGVTRVS